MNTGLRRVSKATVVGQKAGRRYGEETHISRAEALALATRAARAIGLKPAKILLLEQLFACSMPQDWEPGSRPVVWPSNAWLARGLNSSISTMKHHLKGLAEVPFITFADGPTYQRTGLRDAKGKIVYAYGIDLSPIATRYDELKELIAAYEYDVKMRKKLSYRRTVLRREIEAVLANAPEANFHSSWPVFQARLDRLRETRATTVEVLEGVIEALETLRDETTAAYEAALDDRNLDSALSKSRPVQVTAEGQYLVNCNDERRDPYGPQLNPFAASGGDLASEKKPGVTTGEKQPGSRSAADDINHISLTLLRDACPLAHEYVPEAFETWSKLRANTDLFRRMMTVAPQVLDEARLYLGPDLAAVAVMVTYQKSATGLVESPGGYLRTLVQRGRAGHLNLSRSLYGMQKENAGLKALPLLS